MVFNSSLAAFNLSSRSLIWCTAASQPASVASADASAVDSIDVGRYRHTPLSLAAANGHKAVVKLLLEAGAALDPTDRENLIPPSRAAVSGQDAVMKLLLESDAAVDSIDGASRAPLSRAAANGHGVVVKLLVEAGAALDSRDYELKTPLSFAAEAEYEQVVKILIERITTDEGMASHIPL
jgi:ankyrin repeat protein